MIDIPKGPLYNQDDEDNYITGPQEPLDISYLKFLFV